MKTHNQLRNNLKQAILASFSAEELKELAFDLGADSDILSYAGSKEVAVVQFIEYFERREGLPQLIEALLQTRPRYSWQGFDILAEHQAEELVQTATVMNSSLAAWQDTKDNDHVRTAVRAAYRPGIAESLTLEISIPEATLDVLKSRIQGCWARLADELDSAGPDQDEADRAIDRATICVCRELGRLKRLNGSIPAGSLGDLYSRYSCGA